VQPTLAALENWRGLAGTATLRVLDHPECLLILFDTRPVARSFEYRLALPVFRAAVLEDSS
jgi:hypothetical protein